MQEVIARSRQNLSRQLGLANFLQLQQACLSRSSAETFKLKVDNEVLSTSRGVIPALRPLSGSFPAVHGSASRVAASCRASHSVATPSIVPGPWKISTQHTTESLLLSHLLTCDSACRLVAIACTVPFILVDTESITGVGLGMLNGRLGLTPSFACATLLAQVWCPT